MEMMGGALWEEEREARSERLGWGVLVMLLAVLDVFLFFGYHVEVMAGVRCSRCVGHIYQLSSWRY